VSRSKRDHVQEDFYKPFWMKGKQLNNPAELTVDYIHAMLERIVAELCINRFNWKGLPDSVDTRFMEVSLYNYCLVVVFEDQVTGKLLAARATPGGGYDMNMNPLSYRLQPLQTGTLPQHLRNLELSARKVVPVWGNAMRIPDYDIVQFYSSRIAQTERTIDINLKAARMTKILAVDENMRLTVENINRMLENGDYAISVTKQVGAAIEDIVKVLDMGVHPEQIERLSIVRDRFWGNLMGLLGINNANQDKKERLVANEVEGNDDQVGNFRRINLNWRQKAADQITKIWPEHLTEPVTVDYHTDISGERPLLPDEQGVTQEDAKHYAGTVESA
jgi:hypothetical protein